MNNQDNTYRKFVEFEEKTAAIYLTMAARFASVNPELSAFWLEMSMQEKQHANILEFCRFEELFAAYVPDEAQLRSLSDEFAGLAQRAADPVLGIEEAFRIAAELETSELNAIYDNLTSPMNNTIYLAHRKIVTSMPDHSGQLFEQARKYHVREDALAGLAAAHRRGEAG